MRTLASIQKILSIEPIPNADAIEKATVLGWNVVVKKGEFKPGDLCIYFEIDSLLPVREEYGFLQGGGVKRMLYEGKEVEGYRLKTIRLRGQISQGLCLPIGTFPVELKVQDVWKEGKDVTEKLGVIKYEPPVPEGMAGKMRGNFPSFIPKTDETRIQTYPDVLKRYKDTYFYVTEKLDGSSVTFFIKDDEFHVCSRNTDLFDTPDNLIWRVAKEMGIEEKLRQMGMGIVLQGELVGGKVQGNPLKLTKPTIYFFNIYNYLNAEYAPLDLMLRISLQFEIPLVPIVEYYFKVPQTVDEIIKYATKKSRLNEDVWAEGFVFRPREEAKDEDLGRLSFKAINPEYLLKND